MTKESEIKCEGCNNWIKTSYEYLLVKFIEDHKNCEIKTYEQIGQTIGKLVDEKNKAYGSSFDKAGDYLKLLYPDGVKPEQYKDALLLVRIFDKLMRIATNKDALGENPYQDIAGYGILGSKK